MFKVENANEEVVLSGASYEEAREYAVAAEARGEAVRVAEEF